MPHLKPAAFGHSRRSRPSPRGMPQTLEDQFSQIDLRFEELGRLITQVRRSIELAVKDRSPIEPKTKSDSAGLTPGKVQEIIPGTFKECFAVRSTRKKSNMAEKPPSKTELEIARVVWERKSATIREVAEVLGIPLKTVEWYLRRLEEKQYVSSRLDGRNRVYTPGQGPTKVVKDVLSFVQPFIRDRLTAEQVEQLRKMLKKEKRQ